MPSVIPRPVPVKAAILDRDIERAKHLKLAHFKERLEVYGPYLIECPKCQRVFVGASDGEAINRWSAHLVAVHVGRLALEG